MNIIKVRRNNLEKLTERKRRPHNDKKSQLTMTLQKPQMDTSNKIEIQNVYILRIKIDRIERKQYSLR